ncbi:hypothetical protein K9M90_000207 [Listeria monocytogenes]|uniref:Uncharacterized protein n=1 Tax=Listeria innocua ATCC 33091 TaxID=1002366 RepID=A0AB72Z8T7_LISIO|nr:hypothetical protein [Listeria ivanovii]EEO1850747.1 hypothetical protein [Listeria monocytogenes]EHN61239.1 hypothetical protein HMPREF0557_01980 [Listeria innocua ATCC 33091]CDK32537.1 conserved hypothetical protein [Listeria monocytogenes QOC2]EEV4788807.1 hypothetical protein [Listeria monocytogenes]EHC0506950.1 hypothetical protein [Listeria monocytogenes]
MINLFKKYYDNSAKRGPMPTLSFCKSVKESPVAEVGDELAGKAYLLRRLK